MKTNYLPNEVQEEIVWYYKKYLENEVIVPGGINEKRLFIRNTLRRMELPGRHYEKMDFFLPHIQRKIDKHLKGKMPLEDYVTLHPIFLRELAQYL